MRVNRDLISNCWCLPCSSWRGGGQSIILFSFWFMHVNRKRTFLYLLGQWLSGLLSLRERTLTNANLIASRQLKAYEQEKGITSSWLVCSETPLLKHPLWLSKSSHLHNQVFTSQGSSFWILNVIDYVAQLQEVINHFAQVRELAKKMLQENHYASKDIKTQKEFLDRGCRSFAMRMNRRRDIILTSLRFHKSAGEV